MSFKYVTLDLEGIRRGDTFRTSFYIGTEMDLTGATARAQVRKHPSGQVVALELDTALDEQFLTLSKPADVMARIEAGVYHYDVEIKLANGDVHTLFGGKFEIIYDVTR